MDYRALLQKMTYKNTVSYGPSPPCSGNAEPVYMCMCRNCSVIVVQVQCIANLSPNCYGVALVSRIDKL